MTQSRDESKSYRIFDACLELDADQTKNYFQHKSKIKSFTFKLLPLLIEKHSPLIDFNSFKQSPELKHEEIAISAMNNACKIFHIMELIKDDTEEKTYEKMRTDIEKDLIQLFIEKTQVKTKDIQNYFSKIISTQKISKEKINNALNAAHILSSWIGTHTEDEKKFYVYFINFLDPAYKAYTIEKFMENFKKDTDKEIDTLKDSIKEIPDQNPITFLVKKNKNYENTLHSHEKETKETEEKIRENINNNAENRIKNILNSYEIKIEALKQNIASCEEEIKSIFSNNNLNETDIEEREKEINEKIKILTTQHANLLTTLKEETEAKNCTEVAQLKEKFCIKSFTVPILNINKEKQLFTHFIKYSNAPTKLLEKMSSEIVDCEAIYYNIKSKINRLKSKRHNLAQYLTPIYEAIEKASQDLDAAAKNIKFAAKFTVQLEPKKTLEKINSYIPEIGNIENLISQKISDNKNYHGKPINSTDIHEMSKKILEKMEIDQQKSNEEKATLNTAVAQCFDEILARKKDMFSSLILALENISFDAMQKAAKQNADLAREAFFKRAARSLTNSPQMRVLAAAKQLQLQHSSEQAMQATTDTNSYHTPLAIMGFITGLSALYGAYLIGKNIYHNQNSIVLGFLAGLASLAVFPVSWIYGAIKIAADDTVDIQKDAHVQMTQQPLNIDNVSLTEKDGVYFLENKKVSKEATALIFRLSKIVPQEYKPVLKVKERNFIEYSVNDCTIHINPQGNNDSLLWIKENKGYRLFPNKCYDNDEKLKQIFSLTH